MKKNIKILLRLTIIVLATTLSTRAGDIWITGTNLRGDIGCRDTMWFSISNPIPTLENSRGKVVEITTHTEDKNADISNPKNLKPFPDAHVWLSEDKRVIYVVFKNLTMFDPALRNGKGEVNGPFYGIQIYDRFTPKSDNSPDEIIFKEYHLGYRLSRVLLYLGVEEESRLELKEKIGNYWYAPNYVETYQHQLEDTIIDKIELLQDVEHTYNLYASKFFGDRKMLRWETKGRYLDGIEFNNPYNNQLEYTIGCRAITGEIDLAITPIYSKPIPRWNLTITMDSTIKSLSCSHFYPFQQWLPDSISDEQHWYFNGETSYQFSLLKDSADMFYVAFVEANGGYIGLPLRMISNVPEFNLTSDGKNTLKYLRFYYHPGYDSVHIHFTRSAVNSVEENIPEAGLQQLQWQTTSERDILLKTPPLWGEGQVELYTILGTMVQQFDVNTLSRSSEGMLLPTAGIPSGAYIVLVKSKNYRSGTVLQIIH
ncbi:MAG: hypothetical protein JST20_14140 [Bacteroidetes bacterium]|nr:hypothetical protein [Bacteroidota bacterium]